MSIYKEKLLKMGFDLPLPNAPGGLYAPVVREGHIAFTAGQTAIWNGELKVKGRLGEDVTLEQGIYASKICVINCIALINAYGGGLKNISRIIKITGFINSTPNFTDHALVMNGASSLVLDLFGDNGRHARSALGSCGTSRE